MKTNAKKNIDKIDITEQNGGMTNHALNHPRHRDFPHFFPKIEQPTLKKRDRDKGTDDTKAHKQA